MGSSHSVEATSALLASIPPQWRLPLRAVTDGPSFASLAEFLRRERAEGTVYPSADLVFSALSFTSPDSVRAVILGQDPYHREGQAHGLAFSVPPGRARPPSLRNIITELERDRKWCVPPGGSLVPWAMHGVLLLNTVLTVGGRDGKVQSHAGRGWEHVTDEIVTVLAAKPELVVFLLWGAHAIKKRKLIDGHDHVVIESSHPSPRSANRSCGAARPFVASSPFTRANEELVGRGRPCINWDLGGTANSPKGLSDATA